MTDDLKLAAAWIILVLFFLGIAFGPSVALHMAGEKEVAKKSAQLIAACLAIVGAVTWATIQIAEIG
jgi:hypothetical protein